MSRLEKLNIDILEDLDLASINIDLPTRQEAEVAFESHNEEITEEEMEFALSCVMNVKKHLTRATQSGKEMQERVSYVNGLISDAGLRASF
ncbi:MAG: hypothetical protein AB8B73_02735 [Ekhidna sp.]